MTLVEQVYLMVDKFPNKEQYVLVQQMTRCAISIPSNIAEGSAKESQKDFARFLGIALGSSYELETQILLASKLGYCNNTQEIIDLLQSLQRRISGFIKKLNA
jgi:four helix bundle protein